MRMLVTGCCGFVGSAIIASLREHAAGLEIVGCDNFIRPGSALNVERLKALGVKLVHGDIRAASDLEALPKVEWIIDAAANPSVLAGVDGGTTSRQLAEHNLYGTINVLELAKRHRAGLILLSTSRVYSIAEMKSIPVVEANGAFTPPATCTRRGVSFEGISESFSTEGPLSLYGASKRASEIMAIEYGASFGFPVWINRCGVLAGAGQFGRADQGIFAFWINSFLRKAPLKYIGFGGSGFQTRDCLHPRDLTTLLLRQLRETDDSSKPRTINVAGGRANSMSLLQLTQWCEARYGFKVDIAMEPQGRAFDLPWIVLDAELARNEWAWQPQTTIESILVEIATHADENPCWLEISAPLGN